jgi:acyl-coenzyme A synthetase/AMP-(fatty) acid ligase
VLCRYWSMVAKHKITQLYTAPTAIRALIQFGDEVRCRAVQGRMEGSA